MGVVWQRGDHSHTLLLLLLLLLLLARGVAMRLLVSLLVCRLQLVMLLPVWLQLVCLLLLATAAPAAVASRQSCAVSAAAAVWGWVAVLVAAQQAWVKAVVQACHPILAVPVQLAVLSQQHQGQQQGKPRAQHAPPAAPRRCGQRRKASADRRQRGLGLVIRLPARGRSGAREVQLSAWRAQGGAGEPSGGGVPYPWSAPGRRPATIGRSPLALGRSFKPWPARAAVPASS